MNGSEERLVECAEHGSEPPAFVCRHLNLETPVGFVEGFDPEEPEVELYQAWCHACDEVLVEEGEWNDRSEAFAGIHMVCRECYRRMRELHRSGR